MQGDNDQSFADFRSPFRCHSVEKWPAYLDRRSWLPTEFRRTYLHTACLQSDEDVFAPTRADSSMAIFVPQSLSSAASGNSREGDRLGHRWRRL
jgi:hypothetical protein